MAQLQQPKLVTSEEFVTDLLCQLKLNHVTNLSLGDTMEDKRFERAFEFLLKNEDDLNIAVGFSLATNPYHGDSSTLREALYALRERGVVAINNPSFKTVEIKVSRDDADYYLDSSPIPREFMARLVSEIFQTADEQDGER